MESRLTRAFLEGRLVEEVERKHRVPGKPRRGSDVRGDTMQSTNVSRDIVRLK